MRVRHLLIAIVAVAVLTPAGYAAYWYLAANSVRESIAGWAEARRAEGFLVVHGEVAISGFPGRLIARVESPAVARPNGKPAWWWRGDRIIAEAAPWAPNMITVTLPTDMALVYRRGGDDREVTAVLEAGAAWLTLEGGVAQHIIIEATGIDAMTPRGPAALVRFDGEAWRGDGETIEIVFDARRLTLTPDADGPLGREVATVTAVATVTGALPETSDRAALAAWSEAGGTVELRSLGVEWGSLAIEAEGTMTLDQLLRPQAALTARVAGYGDALDAFATAGAMKARDASMAKTFLNIMAKTISGRRIIEVALTAQDGTLYAGPMPLVKLKPVLPE
jgi:hypothetical protein